MTLTVVIPAFNSQDVVRRAVRSCHSVGLHDVIVIDDGSEDSTAAVAKSEGAIVVGQGNGGAAKARRTGLEHVTSEYVIFLDADDELCNPGVTCASEVLRATPDAAAVVAAYSHREIGTVLKPWAEGVSVRSLLLRGQSPAPPGAILWRVDSLREAWRVSPPPLNPRWAEDFEQLIRVALIAAVTTIDDVMCVYTTVGGKSTSNPLNSIQSAQKIREHYASYAGIRIPRVRRRASRALSYYRKASTSPLPSRLFWLMTAVLAAPDYAASRLLRRYLRLREGRPRNE